MRQLKQTRTAEVPQEKPQPKRRKALTLLSAMEEIVEQLNLDYGTCVSKTLNDVRLEEWGEVQIAIVSGGVSNES